MLKKYLPSAIERVREAIEPLKQQGRDCCAGGGYYNDNPYPTETANHRYWKSGMDEQLELEAKVRAAAKTKRGGV
jgi:hypothetical protein